MMAFVPRSRRDFRLAASTLIDSSAQKDQLSTITVKPQGKTPQRSNQKLSQPERPTFFSPVGAVNKGRYGKSLHGCRKPKPKDPEILGDHLMGPWHEATTKRNASKARLRLILETVIAADAEEDQESDILGLPGPISHTP